MNKKRLIKKLKENLEELKLEEDELDKWDKGYNNGYEQCIEDIEEEGEK